MRNRPQLAMMFAILVVMLPVEVKALSHNEVYFPNVENFDFVTVDHSITSGKSWGGVSSGLSDSKGVIRVNADRSGSKAVADWFKERTNLAIGTWRVVPPGLPSKLNFAIYGDMILHGDNGRSARCENVVIGQGHVDTTNNWWIGGEHMQVLGGEYWLVCPPVDGYCGAVVLLSTSGSKNFPLTLRMLPPVVSLALSSEVLWSPDHRMHEIKVTVTVNDVCGGSPDIRLISVDSSEPDSSADVGDIPKDIQGVEYGSDDRIFSLRAERSNDGEGRAYTVTYAVTDGCGKETTAKAEVKVPLRHRRFRYLRTNSTSW